MISQAWRYFIKSTNVKVLSHSLKIKTLLILLKSSVFEQITPQVSSLKTRTFIIEHSLWGWGLWSCLAGWIWLMSSLRLPSSEGLTGAEGLVPSSSMWLWTASFSSSPCGPLPRAAHDTADGLFQSEWPKRTLKMEAGVSIILEMTCPPYCVFQRHGRGDPRGHTQGWEYWRQGS